MKIDLDYEGYRFIWDTDRQVIEVFKPMEKVDLIEMPYHRTINYPDFAKRVKRYMELSLNQL